MRGFDLKPLFPYSVGFDQLDALFDAAARDGGRDTSYPPYNIARTDQNRYRITMAVAGFGDSDIEMVVQEGVLSVKGRLAEPEDKLTYLHRGIARRAFEHKFQLADHVKVSGATLKNGLLDIDLEREIPEAHKPQKIAIRGAAG